jgi:hypothetical protein
LHRVLQWHRVPRQVVRYRVSRFFSGPVLKFRERRDRRCVRGSGGRCILRDSRQPVHVRWALVRGRRWRLRDRRVPEAVLVAPRDVRGNGTYHAG